MATERDPEGIERKYLHGFADFTRGRVLEVGCGNGRLTWQYTNSSVIVAGIDPHRGDLAQFLRDRPSPLSRIVSVCQAECELLPFGDETFDVAVLAWSL